jgi:hypothetical protein
MSMKHSAWAALLLSALAAAQVSAQSEATWVEERTYFSEGLCAFVDPESGLTGYIDKAGKVAIPAQYAEGRPFSEGFAVVGTEDADSEFGSISHYIDKAGNTVKTLDPMQEAAPFSEGLSHIITYTGKSALSEYVDKTFEHVLDLPWDYEFGGSFSDGLAWVSVGDVYDPPDTWRYGFMDKSGALVIPAEFYEPGDFDGGIALVSTGGRRGGYDEEGNEVEGQPGTFMIIDAKGKVLRQIEGGSGTTVLGPRDGVVIHKNPDGVIRAYGAAGAQLYKTKNYEHIFPYSDGLALAIRREPSLEGKDPLPFSYGYLDKKGAVAIPFAAPLGLMSRFSDGLYAYFDFDSGLVGFKDRSGKIAIQPVLSPAMAEEENSGY